MELQSKTMELPLRVTPKGFSKMSDSIYHSSTLDIMNVDQHHFDNAKHRNKI
jgi:hypothetical protein